MVAGVGAQLGLVSSKLEVWGRLLSEVNAGTKEESSPVSDSVHNIRNPGEVVQFSQPPYSTCHSGNPLKEISSGLIKLYLVQLIHFFYDMALLSKNPMTIVRYWFLHNLTQGGQDNHGLR